jgi:serine/threonine-protein kinase RsbW/stage II sporulation protein AB (anti-sigma F factor)
MICQTVRVPTAGAGETRDMELPRARWTAPAKAEEVGRMRRAAAAVAAEHGLEGITLEHFELAISEALTNVVLHAYPDASGPMSVEIESDGVEVRVTITDEGRGLGVQAEHRGLGMGLGIVASSADFCDIRSRRGAGVEITLGFELQ